MTCTGRARCCQARMRSSPARRSPNGWLAFQSRRSLEVYQSPEEEPLRMSRFVFRSAAIGAIAALTTLVPAASAQPAAPKAYVGLFADNSVGVIDTATNKLTKTIPIPAGPHGLVITPDGRWVYASSDADSKLSVIDTT